MVITDLEVRFYGRDVIDELQSLFVELHEHQVAACPRLAGLPAVSREEAWRRRSQHYLRWFESDGTFVVGAHADGGLVGYGIVVVSEGYDGWGEGAPLGEVKDLVVATRVRANGVGKTLLDAVRERLTADGIAEYRLSVMSANREALAFYRRLGFVPSSVILTAPPR